ncbi:MAG: response regulator [Acidobacteriota bacterium]|nr:response regulator [Acidobacteriota bacterium]
MEDQAVLLTPTATPRKILVLLDNLFFAAKINQAAVQANVQPVYAKTSARGLVIARADHPAQIIIDLDEAKCGPLEFLALLKADNDLRAIPTLGFVSHVNIGLQQQAREVGCDRVMARSAFDRNLVALLSQNS